MVCPHAVIRAKVYDSELLSSAPDSFKSTEAKNSKFKGMKFTIQVSPEDCTGCSSIYGANLATAPRGVALDICPPVLE